MTRGRRQKGRVGPQGALTACGGVRKRRGAWMSMCTRETQPPPPALTFLSSHYAFHASLRRVPSTHCMEQAVLAVDGIQKLIHLFKNPFIQKSGKLKGETSASGKLTQSLSKPEVWPTGACRDHGGRRAWEEAHEPSACDANRRQVRCGAATRERARGSAQVRSQGRALPTSPCKVRLQGGVALGV